MSPVDAVDAFLDLQATDANVRQGATRAAVAPLPSPRATTSDELLELCFVHAAVDDDALDPELLEAPHQLAHRLGGARDRDFADDQLVAHDANRDRRRRLMHERDRVGSALTLRDTSGWPGA